MTADEVIGRNLIAEKDVPLFKYASPAAPVVGIVPKGNSFGPVYSYLNKPDGIYWMFDYTIPGNPPGAYYAKHDPAKLKLGLTPSGEPPAVNVKYNIGGIPSWVLYVVGGGLLLLNLLKK
jgi:hypothetical protein